MPRQRAEDVKLRNVGVDGALWEAAKARAADDNVSLSEVIRHALREYVAGRLRLP